ncbi:hypothetical protein ACIBVL_28630 [Streptomyces sp. NPDC049687]|uniref:hypothetical protein n=1 Tax=Streptomyces sp. NPDC049687 TaxID=3365596 RepID=UPI0037B9CC92
MALVHPSGKTRENPLPADFTDGGGAFSGTDLRRLDATIRDARSASTATASALLAPVVPHGDAVSLTDLNCVFDHCAVLLFPTTLKAGLRHLERAGLAPLPPVPSTVVRNRLSARHGLDPELCRIHITRLRLDLPDGRRHPAVEVFLFPHDSRAFDERPGEHLGQRVEESEIENGFENHTAFVVGRPSAPLLGELVTAWRTEAGLLWEGGGHNPHEGGPHGSTVLYFVRDHERPAERRRFELHCAGDLRDVTAALPRQDDAVRRAYEAWPRIRRTAA